MTEECKLLLSHKCSTDALHNSNNAISSVQSETVGELQFHSQEAMLTPPCETVSKSFIWPPTNSYTLEATDGDHEDQLPLQEVCYHIVGWL